MSFYHKPELALRRALELESINQSEAALTLLHDVLSSRRHRTWSPTYEQIMLTYLNLCLKLNKSREAKDGLHQYRNLSQSQAPGSLEKVIRYLMDQAEKKCMDAKASADAIQEIEVAAADDDDDEQFGATSPEAILLSTMSADPAKTQRDSTMLMPSLKFLWETYRTILDILKSNSKLEHVYHAAALGALRFCRVYKRRTEFRRLCDMLRMHLGNLQKYGNLSSIGEDGKPNNKVRLDGKWSRFGLFMLIGITHTTYSVCLYHRFADGKGGRRRLLSFTCKLALNSSRLRVPFICTRRGFVRSKISSIFFRLVMHVASSIRPFLLPRLSSWLPTTRSLRLSFGSVRTISFTPLRGTSTTLFARSTIAA